jgi:hypothetical protein
MVWREDNILLRVLVCIDDTDRIDSEWGTGELASKISENVEERGWGKCHGITRHQLLIHPDIPYTSHNSSMCFTADLNETYLDELINYASGFLAQESATGSDPGLCIAVQEKVTKPEMLIAFGYKAKETVVTKEEAYSLAEQLGIHLSEHGGTGQGIIGALAGVGLRLSGNDGRLKGKLKLKNVNGVISVESIRSQSQVDIVRSLEGVLLADNDLVRLGDTVKSVLLDGKNVLLVFPTADDAGGVRWQTCTKQQLKQF